MTPDSIITADYDADLFVRPVIAHRWVLSRAEAWRARQHGAEDVEDKQVLFLVGERGAGKTWLLQHLVADDPQIAPFAVYTNLEQRGRFATPGQYVEAVEGRVRERRGSLETILLLDTVPPRLDDHLRAFEDAILRPYLANRRSLVIMALVHPSQVCWRSPALRGGERHHVGPFRDEQTQEQVQRLEHAGLVREGLEIDAVQRQSGGLPLLNYLLATLTQTEAYQALLDHWFSRVPDDEHARVLNCLEAVCLLDVLEQGPVRKALEVFCDHNPGAAGCPAHPLGVLNLLRKHWLGQTSPTTPGYVVLVESVRRATQEMLKAREPELFAKLQESSRSGRPE